MIQANLLLATIGKTANWFVTLDLMRLPLGILTGMGFIGGGAILRRDSLVLGVTTAATLWFVTVIGLCFGGGQISLGIAAFVLGMLVLSGLRWFDYRVKPRISAPQVSQSPSGCRARRPRPLEIEAAEVACDVDNFADEEQAGDLVALHSLG